MADLEGRYFERGRFYTADPPETPTHYTYKLSDGKETTIAVPFREEELNCINKVYNVLARSSFIKSVNTTSLLRELHLTFPRGSILKNRKLTLNALARSSAEAAGALHTSLTNPHLQEGLKTIIETLEPFLPPEASSQREH